MTESQWLAGDDPAAMLAYLADPMRNTPDISTMGGFSGRPMSHRVSTDRKLRLFACACVRQAWDGEACPDCSGRGRKDGRRLDESHNYVHACHTCHGVGRVGGLTDPRSRRAVEVAEAFADGKATAAEIQAAYNSAPPGDDGYGMVRSLCVPYYESPLAAYHSRRSAELSRCPPATQADLLRCVLGNPWRPWPKCVIRTNGHRPHLCETHNLEVVDFGVSFRCPKSVDFWLAWNDGCVPKLAAAIYAERRWADLPILCDALEDAGCQDAELLAHGRGPGPHARGCWVIDLLTGRQ